MLSKSALALLFLLSASFSLYTHAPIAQVTEHNLAVAVQLNNTFDPEYSVNGTVAMDFYGTDINWVPIHRHVELPLIRASARLLAIDPSVDGSFSASGNPHLIFAWGSEADGLLPKDWEKNGGSGDDCIEYQKNISVKRNAIIDFKFRNATETVSTADNVVPVPPSILRAMESTSGLDALEVALNATFAFTYAVDDRLPAMGGCMENIVEFTSAVNVADQMNFTAAGNRALFFLARPVLLEQWHANNHFDVVVLSNSKLGSAAIFSGENQSKEFLLSLFNVTAGSYGLKRIVSVPANDSEAGSHTALNNPFPIDSENSTYAYLYEFNYTYEGIGKKTLWAETSSVFGDNATFSRTIHSRTLSHSGNIPEVTGTGAEDMRKSAYFGGSEMRSVFLDFGLLGILVIIILAGRLTKIN